MLAILINGMQKDSLSEGHPNYIGSMARGIVPNICRVVDAARRKDIPVVYVNSIHIPNDPFVVGVGRPEHCIQGTPGAEVIDELAPMKGDYIVNRRKLGAFFATDLDIILKDALKASTIVMTGLVIEFGMYATTIDALQLGYKVIIPADCCASRTEERRGYALTLLKFLQSISIITADELIRDIDSGAFD